MVRKNAFSESFCSQGPSSRPKSAASSKMREFPEVPLCARVAHVVSAWYTPNPRSAHPYRSRLWSSQPCLPRSSVRVVFFFLILYASIFVFCQVILYVSIVRQQMLYTKPHTTATSNRSAVLSQVPCCSLRLRRRLPQRVSD